MPTLPEVLHRREVVEPDPGVIVPLRWPDQARRRNQLADAGVPRLLLVAAGVSPPSCWALDEDWVAEDADPAERAHRERTLRHRLSGGPVPTPRAVPGVFVDEDGLVRRDGRWVALSALEAALVRPLLAERGRCVGRPALAAAAWPGQDREDRAVDGAVRRLRAKLHPLGVEIHGITGAGYLLEVVGPAPVEGVPVGIIG